jgi:hypothetical protein
VSFKAGPAAFVDHHPCLPRNAQPAGGAGGVGPCQRGDDPALYGGVGVRSGRCRRPPPGPDVMPLGTYWARRSATASKTASELRKCCCAILGLNLFAGPNWEPEVDGTVHLWPPRTDPAADEW